MNISADEKDFIQNDSEEDDVLLGDVISSTKTMYPQRRDQRSNNSKRGRKKAVFGMKNSKKRKTVDPLQLDPSECCFCHEKGNILCGTFFQDTDSGIAAHQFCMLFSAGLPQRGNDNEGFEGFIFNDILKEATRASKLACKFCQQLGASSGCSVKTCKAKYHFKCGLNEDIQFVYAHTFNTYCPQHRAYQDLSYLEKSSCTCPVCLETIDKPNHKEILKTPCCKNVFVHRECVQRQADSSGYFFKCPTCNNKDAFQEEMFSYGIYIPQRDASWEENNAFADLLIQYDRCDSKKCLCPYGVKHESQFVNNDWELLRCFHCGQGAVHRKCLGKYILPSFEYICYDCNQVMKEKIPIEAVVPSEFQLRTDEHKKRLAELTLRGDPVLCSSTQFAHHYWQVKFNIHKCHVVLQPLIPNVVARIENNILKNAAFYFPHHYETNKPENEANTQGNNECVSTNLEGHRLLQFIVQQNISVVERLNSMKRKITIRKFDDTCGKNSSASSEHFQSLQNNDQSDKRAIGPFPYTHGVKSNTAENIDTKSNTAENIGTKSNIAENLDTKKDQVSSQSQQLNIRDIIKKKMLKLKTPDKTGVKKKPPIVLASDTETEDSDDSDDRTQLVLSLPSGSSNILSSRFHHRHTPKKHFDKSNITSIANRRHKPSSKKCQDTPQKKWTSLRIQDGELNNAAANIGKKKLSKTASLILGSISNPSSKEQVNATKLSPRLCAFRMDDTTLHNCVISDVDESPVGKIGKSKNVLLEHNRISNKLAAKTSSNPDKGISDPPYISHFPVTMTTNATSTTSKTRFNGLTCTVFYRCADTKSPISSISSLPTITAAASLKSPLVKDNSISPASTSNTFTKPLKSIAFSSTVAPVTMANGVSTSYSNKPAHITSSTTKRQAIPSSSASLSTNSPCVSTFNPNCEELQAIYNNTTILEKNKQITSNSASLTLEKSTIFSPLNKEIKSTQPSSSTSTACSSHNAIEYSNKRPVPNNVTDDQTSEITKGSPIPSSSSITDFLDTFTVDAPSSINHSSVQIKTNTSNVESFLPAFFSPHLNSNSSRLDSNSTQSSTNSSVTSTLTASDVLATVTPAIYTSLSVFSSNRRSENTIDNNTKLFRSSACSSSPNVSSKEICFDTIRRSVAGVSTKNNDLIKEPSYIRLQCVTNCSPNKSKSKVVKTSLSLKKKTSSLSCGFHSDKSPTKVYFPKNNFYTSPGSEIFNPVEKKKCNTPSKKKLLVRDACTPTKPKEKASPRNKGVSPSSRLKSRTVYECYSKTTTPERVSANIDDANVFAGNKKKQRKRKLAVSPTKPSSSLDQWLQKDGGKRKKIFHCQKTNNGEILKDVASILPGSSAKYPVTVDEDDDD